MGRDYKLRSRGPAILGIDALDTYTSALLSSYAYTSECELNHAPRATNVVCSILYPSDFGNYCV
jgi:hypothetical protein